MSDAVEPKPTIRARILVAIDRRPEYRGSWVSHGHSAATNQSVKEWIWSEDLTEDDLYLIEADLPMPDEVVPLRSYIDWDGFYAAESAMARAHPWRTWFRRLLGLEVVLIPGP
jgi:hypothetical protein